MPSDQPRTGSSDRSSTSQFDLLGLPLELRIMVYERCLISPGDIVIQHVAHDREELESDIRRRPNVNVLLANKQVYGEAAPVLYGRNTFRFYLQPNGETDFNVFEARLTNISRNGIRHLDFTFIRKVTHYRRGVHDRLSNLKRLPRLQNLRIHMFQDVRIFFFPLMEYVERNKGSAEVNLVISRMRCMRRVLAVDVNLLDAVRKWDWTVAGDFQVKAFRAVPMSTLGYFDPWEML